MVYWGLGGTQGIQGTRRGMGASWALETPKGCRGVEGLNWGIRV